MTGWSVRARLTFLYASLLALMLVVYAAGASALLWGKLRDQMDHRLAEDLETTARHLRFDSAGHIQVTAASLAEDVDLLAPHLVQVWSAGGEVLFRSPELREQNLDKVPAARLRDGSRVRVAELRATVEGTPVVIRLGFYEEPLWREVRRMASVLLTGLPFAVLLAAATAYLVARRALRPLDVMANRAGQITAEQLDDRLPIANPHDELGRLGSIFNATLARLERSFEQLRRFTADASHELRTPLTAIRSVGEVALQKPADAAYYRDAIGSMLEEVNRLTRLVDNLLAMSRADSGRVALQCSDFRLLELARESAAMVEVLAEEKQQTLTVEGDPSISVHADRLLLRQALLNLIDNAVRYTPSKGRVEIRVGRDSAGAYIDVRDNGPGIPEEHRAKVFERFYRIDKARSREDGGAGLGLAISDWAVRAHAGQIELQSDSAEGCTFRIHLTAGSESPAGLFRRW